MKSVSRMVIALSLALGGAVVVAPPAMAKDKPAKAPSVDLSKPVREAVAAAQEAMKTSDTATAAAKIASVRGSLSTPDDSYFVGSMLYEIGRKTNDNGPQADGIALMLASGKAPPEQAVQMYLAQGSLAYNAKDYVKAEAALKQAMAANTTDLQAYALLAETENQLGRPAESVALLTQAAQKERAAGRKLPADYYGRGVAIAYKAKLGPAVEKLTQEWLVDYPTTSNWRDSLIVYRDTNATDADYDLDISRLLRATGALKGERDYMEYVQATYLKFPAEAKAVLEEGQSKGMLNTSAGTPKELYDLTKGKISADKASLSKKVSTGKSALAVADAYASYGQWADAIEMYRAALTMGGADANVVNTRLGVALAKSGDKAGAKQAFAAVTGPRAALAHYWTIWIDGPAPAAS